MSAWRPVLRLAWRSVRHAPVRALLVVALVAVPIAGLTVTDGILGSTRGPDVYTHRAFGTADARLVVTGHATVDYPYTGSGTGRRDHAVDLGALLPAGSRTVRDVVGYCTSCLRLTSDGRHVTTELDLVTVGDPLTAHRVRHTSGRLPTGPAEVLVTPALDERVGDTLTVGGTTVTVSGVAVHPLCPRCEVVIAAPGSPLEDALLDTARAVRARPDYLVDLPPGTDADALGRTLAASGVALTTPATYHAAMADAPVSDAPLLLAGGLGLLVVVVLAGAAFAVGARRQERELGLLADNGGTTGHLRGVVLAQGLLLGVVGTAVGVLAGLLAAVLGAPLWERVADQLIDSWRFPWVAAIAVAGVLACVAAAVAPSVAATRPAGSRPRARFVLPGAVFLAVGTLVLVAGAVAGPRLWSDENTAAACVVGAVLAVVVGLVLAAPAGLAAAGRLGGRLPLAARLAVREAARHRPRTVAGVVAVTVTVATSVVLGFWFASDLARAERPTPTGTLLLGPDPAARVDGLDETVRRFTAALPGSTGHLVEWTENPANGPVYLYPPDERPGCDDPMAALGMATPDVLALVAGEQATALRSALAAGEVVVFDDCFVDTHGSARAMTGGLPAEEAEEAVLPAHVAAPVPGYSRLPSAFIDPAAARARGLVPYVETAVVTVPAGTGADALAAAAAAADGVLETSELSPPDHRNLALLVATLVALAGVVVTLALSAAEGRADLATLAVLGAQPWRGRTLAGAHALLIGGTGTVLGVGFGSAAALAAIHAVPRIEPAVPWGHLTLTVLAVPVLAIVVAVLGTRARLPEGGRRE